jgi:hypothetical protein
MTMTEEKKKTKKKGNMWHIHAFLVKKKKFEKVLYNQKVKPKCTVLPASCIMMITPHIMTHDTTLIVLTPLSHGTHFTFTFSTLSLSLSLSLFYFLSLFLFFFKRRSGGRCGREERRRRRRGSAKGPYDRIWGLIFYEQCYGEALFPEFILKRAGCPYIRVKQVGHQI